MSHLSTTRILLYIIFADLPAHLEVYTYDIATDRRAEYLYCLDKALSIAEEFQSLTLPWFVATSQNRDVIFWVIDVVRDPLVTSEIDDSLLNHV